MDIFFGNVLLRAVSLCSYIMQRQFRSGHDVLPWLLIHHCVNTTIIPDGEDSSRGEIGACYTVNIHIKIRLAERRTLMRYNVKEISWNCPTVLCRKSAVPTTVGFYIGTP